MICRRTEQEVVMSAGHESVHHRCPKHPNPIRDGWHKRAKGGGGLANRARYFGRWAKSEVGGGEWVWRLMGGGRWGGGGEGGCEKAMLVGEGTCQGGEEGMGAVGCRAT